MPTSTIISTDFNIRSTYPVDFRDDSDRVFFLDHHGSFVFCERKGRRQAAYSEGSGESDLSSLQTSFLLYRNLNSSMYSSIGRAATCVNVIDGRSAVVNDDPPNPLVCTVHPRG